MSKLVTVLFGAVLAIAHLSADAAVITLEGDNLIFKIAGEQSSDFGDYTLSGDTLRFSPAGFAADADGPNEMSHAQSVMTVWVQAKGSYLIDALGLTESGSYSVEKGAWAKAKTSVMVNDFGRGETHGASYTKVLNGLEAGSWDWAWSKELGGATMLHIVLGDFFSARASRLGADASVNLAFLELKFGGVPALPVPLPGAAWLLGLGLIGIAAAGRRLAIRPVL